jgi:hypothetical protein
VLPRYIISFPKKKRWRNGKISLVHGRAANVATFPFSDVADSTTAFLHSANGTPQWHLRGSFLSGHGHAGDRATAPISPKRTFDLALFSNDDILLIEAKARQTAIEVNAQRVLMEPRSVDAELSTEHEALRAHGLTAPPPSSGTPAPRISVYERQREPELRPDPADDEASLLGDADASFGREGSRSDPGCELGPVPAKGTADLCFDAERALRGRARGDESRVGGDEEQAGTGADGNAQSGQVTRRDCRLEQRVRFDCRRLAERRGMQRPRADAARPSGVETHGGSEPSAERQPVAPALADDVGADLGLAGSGLGG